MRHNEFCSSCEKCQLKARRIRPILSTLFDQKNPVFTDFRMCCLGIVYLYNLALGLCWFYLRSVLLHVLFPLM